MNPHKRELRDANSTFMCGFLSPHSRSGDRKSWPTSYMLSLRLTLHSMPMAVKPTEPKVSITNTGFVIRTLTAIIARKQQAETIANSIRSLDKPCANR